MDETIRTSEDLLAMLDALLRDVSAWWDRFYEDRSRPVPFFVDAPDENLVEWVEGGRIKAGRVLELGCGPGRNAVYLAERGFQVDAMDASQAAIDWARERAAEHGVEVSFARASSFEFPVEAGAYDLVYDSGCLHHVPPHRRLRYVPLAHGALRPSGLLGLVCMRTGCEYGGADMSDWEVYRGWSMRGGLGYTRERLMALLVPPFELIELRTMREIEPGGKTFGRSFLQAALFQKR